MKPLLKSSPDIIGTTGAFEYNAALTPGNPDSCSRRRLAKVCRLLWRLRADGAEHCGVRDG
jgi:hypothetical protein